MNKISERSILAHAKREALSYGLGFLRMSFRPGVEAGWPDVMILGPNRCVLFLELKAPNKPLRPLQAERGRQIMTYGHAYAKCDSKEGVSQVIEDFAAICIKAAGK